MSLQNWMMILLGILYIGYLCWVMFGGMCRKKIKPLVYVIMTVLILWGVISQFNGVHSKAEVINICMILLIGLVKGIWLGRKKVVEKIDGVWYLHHTWSYILIWVIFFAVKTVLSRILTYTTGVSMPLWHMILYFAFYYPWRTINVFIANPEMRKEVLKFSKRKNDITHQGD